MQGGQLAMYSESSSKLRKPDAAEQPSIPHTTPAGVAEGQAAPKSQAMTAMSRLSHTAIEPTIEAAKRRATARSESGPREADRAVSTTLAWFTFLLPDRRRRSRALILGGDARGSEITAAALTMT
jgi:hypothetical protein